jgi:hypothetical protein
MLGQKTLFDRYLNKPTGGGKGRSAELIDDRNSVLIARFYYHMEIKRLRYDDIIHQLQREFFLSEQRIVDVLTGNQNILDNYMDDKPATKELKHLFSWFVWE